LKRTIGEVASRSDSSLMWYSGVGKVIPVTSAAE
jgi:hypothetical protein